MKKTVFTSDRLCALSDGVYAIVLTLLVLELKVPESAYLSETALEEVLYEQRLKFAAYLISFFAITKFWVDHHAVFNIIRKTDHGILGANFVHLLFLSLLPFSSSLVGGFASNHPAQFIFLAGLALCGLSQALILGYASRHEHLIAKEIPRQLQINQFRKILFIPTISAISAVFALFHHNAMFIFWLLAPAALVLMNRLMVNVVDPSDLPQASGGLSPE
jgi:uncharacterized membrane protein